MKFLLDTHVLLWSLGAPEKLDSVARAHIEDEANDVYFSSASVWELAIKSSKGSLQLHPEFFSGLEDAPFVELPIRTAHAWAIREISLPHADPFDRLLLAQAKIEGLVFVTRDQMLQNSKTPILRA